MCGGCCFSPASSMGCDKGFSEGHWTTALKQKKGDLSHSRWVIYIPPPLHLHFLFSDFGLLQEGRWWQKWVLCMVLFPSVCFCAGKQTYGLTSRFPWFLSCIACLIKDGGSQGHRVPNGNIQFLWILHVTGQLSLHLPHVCRGTCLG